MMNAVEYGSEHPQTILLLHGGGLSWWNFSEAAEALAQNYHVVLPVLDGHAQSDHPFTSIEDNAERLIRLIDERFDGHVLLIGGVSLGGQILAEILSRRGDICEYAVIESALAVPMRCTAALIRPAFELCYPLIRKRWFAKLQFSSLHIKPGLFEQYYRDSARITRKDMIAFLSANAAYRAKASIARCSARALVLVGSRERPVMKRSAEKLAGMLKGAELEILKGFRHGDLSINHAQLYAEKLMSLIHSKPTA